ncbi:MAG: PIN domain-containing protein [bacterium]|nr:PIN domain-containing protein [bacterium]MCP4967685.1 PIN domain-containing protein [bacterium]
MLIVDTGVPLAAADSGDPDHLACVSLLRQAIRPLVTSPLEIAETSYLIGRQLGSNAEARFVRSVANGDITIEQLTTDDLNRIADLVDLGLGATDASVVALAERLGQDSIATTDHRHFTVIRSITGAEFRLVP